MPLREIRLFEHLLKTAHELFEDDRGLMTTFHGFKFVMWPDNADMERFEVTREQSEHCLKRVFAEITRRWPE
jgi:hypothetical protein